MVLFGRKLRNKEVEVIEVNFHEVKWTSIWNCWPPSLRSLSVSASPLSWPRHNLSKITLIFRDCKVLDTRVRVRSYWTIGYHIVYGANELLKALIACASSHHKVQLDTRPIWWFSVSDLAVLILTICSLFSLTRARVCCADLESSSLFKSVLPTIKYSEHLQS